MEALGDMVAAHGIAMVLGLLVLRIGSLCLREPLPCKLASCKLKGFKLSEYHFIRTVSVLTVLDFNIFGLFLGFNFKHNLK